MTPGKRVRCLREIRGLSLTQLHKLSGLSISYLSDIENGKCQMSLKTLYKLAETLEAEPGYICCGKTISQEPAEVVGNCKLPEDILIYVTKAESHSFIRLAQRTQEHGISYDFLKKLLDLCLGDPLP